METDDRDLNEWWQMQQKKVQGQADLAYQDALAKGIAKEQARALLPEGLTQSTLYMSGTLRSWIHYIELRGANGTQKEHMDIAKACASVIAEIFPMASNVLQSN